MTKFVEVNPSKRIFTELGFNTYEYIDLISELVDNSIAAKIEDQLLLVRIKIGDSKDPSRRFFKIQDNASGIPFEILGEAISPGARGGGTTLNEHGVGMKQAIASMGTLGYLLTKTRNDKMANRITKFDWGSIPCDEVKVRWESGTEILVKDLKPCVDLQAMNYTRSYVKKLGARYRRYLKHDNPKMNLKIEIINLDTDSSKHWNIEEVKPVYFHPSTRRNAPVVERKRFKGEKWEAELTFGYAPTDSEYEELGIETDKYNPYHVSISNQGLDLIKNDRVINFHQLSEIGIVQVRHSDYNFIRGELDLKCGFTTAVTKNTLMFDSNFQALVTSVTDFLTSKGFLSRKTWPKEIPENVLRDRLAHHLKNRSVDPKKNVVKEFVVNGLDGSIDILADDVAYEISTVQADSLMIYQLFAYMDMGGISRGVFVAPDYSSKAQNAVNFIEKNHNKKIILAKQAEFPISHALTKDEIG